MITFVAAIFMLTKNTLIPDRDEKLFYRSVQIFSCFSVNVEEQEAWKTRSVRTAQRRILGRVFCSYLTKALVWYMGT
ncbi:hypothetical protein L6164_029814 [Bauhinia variegata]|uniref:Uncharacterized protein n=1 Tax=Bauhinia variegata TaxID=167791 RepID=A0ACB9L9Z7_BAUVA|nr:hypothetical protein L6164_029814 [Bauhinia variegata]